MLRYPISVDLGRLRDLVRAYAEAGGLRGERLEDLVLAVNEAVTNVLDHAGGAGTLTLRARPGAVTVQIEDTSGRLTREHLDSAEIDPAAMRGYGLWIIQRLCDRVHLQRTGRGALLTLTMHTARTSGPASSPGCS
ncbi:MULTISPECIES: ATP-binding protein [unclassified Nonomuraea]|uniref:ATP-binding protein n=1 Tax=unclassified Nonomuraea TaxID=2593643 RepID=UPI0033C4E3E7